MGFDTATLRRSVAETWEGVFGLPTEALDQAIPHGVRRQYLSAIIQITGEWVGSVIIDYSPTLARRMASMFNDCTPEVVTFPQMRDVLGETVNIVAGHVKDCLPGGCLLSLPAVVAGLDYRLLVAGARPAARQAFECEGEPFQLTVFELDHDQLGGGGDLGGLRGPTLGGPSGAGSF